MEGEAWLLIIFGPPLVLTGLGLALAANPRLDAALRRRGLLLVLVGVAQVVLTLVSFAACTPFDSDPCHEGSWWTGWPLVVIGWGISVALMLGAVLLAVVRGLRSPRS